jgi:outer membrane protein assembly factor BamB
LSDAGISSLQGVANNTIYIPKWDENKIVCLDTDGNQLFEMFNEDLRAPLGITSDSNGNLYHVYD